MSDYLKRIAATLLLITLALALTACGLRRDLAPVYAFAGVNVVRPGLDKIDFDQAVVVRGEKIVRVGPANDIEIPAGATVISVDSAYLMPGLAEMHAHVPLKSQGEQYLNDMLLLWIANGVTTIRGMFAEAYHLELRSLITHNEVLGPRLYTAGPSLNRSSVKTVEQARTKVSEQAAAGYDFVKMHPGLTPENYDSIAETAAAIDIPFVGHVSQDVGLWHALESGQASIEHLDEYLPALVRADADTPRLPPGPGAVPLAALVDESRIVLVAQATAKAGVWNTPTETASENFILPGDLQELAARPEMAYMPARMVRGWLTAKRGMMKAPGYDPKLARQFVTYRRQLIKALQDAGAGLLLGSDAPQILNVPGFSIHRELRLLVDSGLTPAQALSAGTNNAAKFLKQENVFGKVTEGLAADLVLLQANPLDDISNAQNIIGVMLRGQWFSRTQLDEVLERIQAQYAR